jgi:hypothetical protein
MKKLKPRGLVSKATEKSDRTQLMLAYLCIASQGRDASLPARVDILDRFDLPDADIAKICKCSVQSVANARQIAKRSR